ncbi:hypothetical protein NEOKW01_1754 [Nematocida sp. AWRm80]|nr:hypothetical protein NEOKW01_1754 [Nematocida sp. AWRm80]
MKYFSRKSVLKMIVPVMLLVQHIQSTNEQQSPVPTSIKPSPAPTAALNEPKESKLESKSATNSQSVANNSSDNQKSAKKLSTANILLASIQSQQKCPINKLGLKRDSSSSSEDQDSTDNEIESSISEENTRSENENALSDAEQSLTPATTEDFLGKFAKLNPPKIPDYHMPNDNYYTPANHSNFKYRESPSTRDISPIPSNRQEHNISPSGSIYSEVSDFPTNLSDKSHRSHNGSLNGSISSHNVYMDNNHQEPYSRSNRYNDFSSSNNDLLMYRKLQIEKKKLEIEEQLLSIEEKIKSNPALNRAFSSNISLADQFGTNRYRANSEELNMNRHLPQSSSNISLADQFGTSRHRSGSNKLGSKKLSRHRPDGEESSNEELNDKESTRHNYLPQYQSNFNPKYSTQPRNYFNNYLPVSARSSDRHVNNTRSYSGSNSSLPEQNPSSGSNPNFNRFKNPYNGRSTSFNSLDRKDGSYRQLYEFENPPYPSHRYSPEHQSSISQNTSTMPRSMNIFNQPYLPN